MDKKSLRQKAKVERQKLTQEEIEDKRLAIANQLLRMNIWDKLYYHLFLTIEEQNPYAKAIREQLLHELNKLHQKLK